MRFPEITTAPGANPAKRVLMLDASASEPDHLYGAIEVGGTIRSTDGGEHWENLSHGQYLNDDYVDMHGVLASRWRPGTVFGIARAGMFRSADGGDHWSHVPLEPLNAKGQIYCRDIREVPGNPRHLWVAAGAGFISDLGILLHSRDGGDSWAQVDVGAPVPHTMFKVAFDERQPSRMSCATNGGEVWTSPDAGESWTAAAAAAGRHAGLRPGARLITGYFVGPDEYEEFRRFRESRRSFATAELPEEKVEAIRASRMDPRHAHLNAMLDPK